MGLLCICQLCSVSLDSMLFTYTPMNVIECWSGSLSAHKIVYNFQQWISWLSHRWRTQRNAISNVNCRIQWIIESLNASCAPWYSEEHACLSVIKFSTTLFRVAWIWGFIIIAGLSAPLKLISGTLVELSTGVIIIYIFKTSAWMNGLMLLSKLVKWNDNLDLKSGRTTRWT